MSISKWAIALIALAAAAVVFVATEFIFPIRPVGNLFATHVAETFQLLQQVILSSLVYIFATIMLHALNTRDGKIISTRCIGVCVTILATAIVFLIDYSLAAEFKQVFINLFILLLAVGMWSLGIYLIIFAERVVEPRLKNLYPWPSKLNSGSSQPWLDV